MLGAGLRCAGSAGDDNWTTTSQGFGTHVDQPSSALFQVPLSAVLSGQINYGDISNIHFAYAGITFDLHPD